MQERAQGLHAVGGLEVGGGGGGAAQGAFLGEEVCGDGGGERGEEEEEGGEEVGDVHGWLWWWGEVVSDELRWGVGGGEVGAGFAGRGRRVGGGSFEDGR